HRLLQHHVNAVVGGKARDRSVSADGSCNVDRVEPSIGEKRGRVVVHALNPELSRPDSGPAAIDVADRDNGNARIPPGAQMIEAYHARADGRDTQRPPA